MSDSGDEYEWTRGSDVDRDGMYLEVSSRRTGELLAEVFYSDQTGKMTLTVFDINLPLPVVGDLVARAKELLPPVSD